MEAADTGPGVLRPEVAATGRLVRSQEVVYRIPSHHGDVVTGL